MADTQSEPQELKQKLEAKEDFLLIDGRQPWEHERVSIPGSRLIPMGRLPEVVTNMLAEKREVILYCHHGVRSLDSALWLRSRGVGLARSLSGGIDRWSLGN